MEKPDWIAMRKTLDAQGVKVGQYTIEWDVDAGNSVFCRGQWAGCSVNDLAKAYAKYFSLTIKTYREPHQ